jgi:hypothetical protein
VTLLVAAVVAGVVTVDHGDLHQDLTAVGALRTAQALAVHRDRPVASAYGFGLGCSPMGTALFALLAAIGHGRLGTTGL